MRRVMLGLISAGLVAAAFSGGARLVEHNHAAANAVCLGNQTADGKCDAAWVNYSVESRKNASGDDSKMANCPKATSTQQECYQRYDDSRQTSSNWGSPANTPVDGGTTLGPLQYGGLFYGGGSTDVRVWTGVRVIGEGSGSVAVGAGQNKSGHLYECATLYGGDETSDHSISKNLNDAGISDDRSDYETDGQVCGELVRGVL